SRFGFASRSPCFYQHGRPREAELRFSARRIACIDPLDVRSPRRPDELSPASETLASGPLAPSIGFPLFVRRKLFGRTHSARTAHNRARANMSGAEDFVGCRKLRLRAVRH